MPGCPVRAPPSLRLVEWELDQRWSEPRPALSTHVPWAGSAHPETPVPPDGGRRRLQGVRGSRAARLFHRWAPRVTGMEDPPLSLRDPSASPTVAEPDAPTWDWLASEAGLRFGSYPRASLSHRIKRRAGPKAAPSLSRCPWDLLINSGLGVYPCPAVWGLQNASSSPWGLQAALGLWPRYSNLCLHCHMPCCVCLCPNFPFSYENTSHWI